jgi:hypothetical protein
MPDRHKHPGLRSDVRVADAIVLDTLSRVSAAIGVANVLRMSGAPALTSG